jgi:hypothetical protein
MSHAAKADRFLQGLEDRTLADLLMDPYRRKTGLLRWASLESFNTLEPDIWAGDINLLFEREKGVCPDWTPPAIRIEQVAEVGEEAADREEGSSDLDMEGVDTEWNYVDFSEDRSFALLETELWDW